MSDLKKNPFSKLSEGTGTAPPQYRNHNAGEDSDESISSDDSIFDPDRSAIKPSPAKTCRAGPDPSGTPTPASTPQPGTSTPAPAPPGRTARKRQISRGSPPINKKTMASARNPEHTGTSAAGSNSSNVPRPVATLVDGYHQVQGVEALPQGAAPMLAGITVNARAPSGTAGAAPAADPLDKIAAMIAGLERKLEDTSSANCSKLDSLQSELFSKVDKGLDEMKRRTGRQDKKIADLELRLPSLIAGIVDKKLANTTTNPPSTGQWPRPSGRNSATTSLDARREEAFLQARRSFKIYPVGNTLVPLHEAVSDFFVQHMSVPHDVLAGLEYTCQRKRDFPESKIKSEVLVVFATPEERDQVKKFAKNFIGESGLRLEIPPHLRGNFRVLSDLAFLLKKKNPRLRRNIKFDEARGDLALDFSVDGTTWKTVLPEDARASVATRRRSGSISTADIADLLDDEAPLSPGPGERDEDGNMDNMEDDHNNVSSY